MMQGAVRYSAIAAIIPAYLISVLISADNAAQAKSRTVAVACGKELQQQCSRVPVAANNMLECLQKSQVSRRCAALAHKCRAHV